MNDSVEKPDRIISEQYLRPGDFVAYHFVEADDDDGYTKRQYPNGHQFVVTGHSEYLDHVPINRSTLARPAGVYKRFGRVFLRDAITDQPIKETISPHYLVFVDPEVKKADRRLECHTVRMCQTGERISDLPALPYEIGDRVRWLDKDRFGDGLGRGEVAKIGNINYHYIGLFCSDEVTPMPLYDIVFPQGGQTSVRPEDIELVERGNYYHWQHDRTQLKFESLAEEASFYKSLGFSEEIRNPATQFFSWSQREAVEAIRRGEACAYRVSTVPFSGAKCISVIAFPTMPELHARLRAATMEGHPEGCELDSVDPLQAAIEAEKTG